ncbi:MAG: TolC family protein [Candidatus Delongbacteria bacterium]|nr:TolC family protein [Candidatus Delongbacteria bacterium]MBN2834768.1 TolC family protein [Candidatus Delongbacteria bacterium]
MKKIIILILTLISLLFSEEKLVLNLDNALSRAFDKNEDLLTAKQDLEGAQYKYDEAYSSAFPRIDAKITYLRNLYSSEISNMSYAITGLSNQITGINNYLADNFESYSEGNRSQTPMPSEDVDAVSDNTLSMEVNLVQPIWLGGKVGTAVRIAEFYEKLSNENFLLRKDKLVLSISKLYYSVLMAKEAYNVMIVTKDDANKNLKNIELMFNNGLVSEYDLIKAKARVLELDPKVIEFKNKYILAQNSLKSELGIDFKTKIDLEGKIENTNMPIISNNYAELAENNRRELTILDLQSKMYSENVQIEFAGFLPNILAVGNYTFKSQNNDFADTFEKNYGVNAISAGITANWSLFSGGETKAKVDQAKVDLKKSELSLNKTRRLLVLEAEQNYNNVKMAMAEIDSEKEFVREAEKALKIANTRYENGLGTQLEVIDAQTSLEQARLKYVQAEYNLKVYYLDYLYSIGEIKS